MTPTDEQLAIYSWCATGSGHGVIDAKAGTGKTTTIINALPHMAGSVYYGAFNKKMAEELQARLTGKHALRATASTIHSAGYAAMKAHLNGKMPKNLGDDKLLELAGGRKKKEAYKIARAVSLGKKYGIGLPEINIEWADIFERHDIDVGEDIENFVFLCEDVLRRSNESGMDQMDYDDMIYLPLLWNAPFKKYDWNVLDEAQDISTIRLLLAKRQMKPGSRLLAVGDPNQAIYGFTGADVESMSNIVRDFSAQVFPLSVTWRCPTSVVESIHHIVPDIKARPGAPAGEVRVISRKDYPDEVRYGDMVLCRLNKPLVAEALRCIREGLRARIEGRDLGKGLIALANRRRWHDLEDLEYNLEAILEKEHRKAMEADSRAAQAKYERMQDQVDTLKILIGRAYEVGARNPSAFASMIDSLFGDNVQSSDSITFSSVHKAKGLENPRVFILGRFELMPFKFAKLEWEMQQEDNLIYVAHTRAKETLFLVGEPPL